jgi:hypothetical protein
LPPLLTDTAIGMILGDAGIFKKSKKSGIKFEQSFQQKDFLFHLFTLWDLYTFMEMPGQRLDHKSQTIKSFWFKTFSHYSFTLLWENFYKNGKKVLPDNLILNSLTPLGFAYWIMCDGSLQKCKKVLIIHTQGFTKEENLLAVKDLDKKWGLNCKVIPHKSQYWVIKTSSQDIPVLRTLLKPYLIPSMLYKLPYKKMITN